MSVKMAAYTIRDLQRVLWVGLIIIAAVWAGVSAGEEQSLGLRCKASPPRGVPPGTSGLTEKTPSSHRHQANRDVAVTMSQLPGRPKTARTRQTALSRISMVDQR